MKRTIERRNAPEVNAGSMADIAFLLLIFFLVTTTIMSDNGLLVKLPPWDPTPPQQDIHTRNLFRVAINSQNLVLVRGEEQPIAELKDAVKAFIMNPAGNPELADQPNKAVVSLINDRSTSYETYLEVYNELKSAYNELWEQAAQQRYGRSYHELPHGEQAVIRQDIPFVISEAEPTDHVPTEE
ncbi:MAG: biopolymer transporter ExbD [Bacteroidota bacterium]